MRLSEATKIIGSMGFPSKMPGTSYGLPAAKCIAGAKLAMLPGSICSLCYALGGRANYQRPKVVQGHERRLQAITDPRWVEAMVAVLATLHSKPAIKWRFGWKEPGFHRWHDTGDLQSVEHFEKIVEVCQLTPTVRHWLATRELAIVRGFKGEIPDNLTVRASATWVDGAPPIGWPLTSAVHAQAPREGAYECPAPKQGHMCGACRACWSQDVPLVSYKLH